MDPSKTYLQRIVGFALAEDLGAGDVTSQAVLQRKQRGRARIHARQRGILAGREIVAAVFAELDASVKVTWDAEDGDRICAEQVVARLEGGLAALLGGERVALNFLARMSGIATLTRRFVEAVGGHQARILDTRKTTPGLRHLEKYAVRCGGGENHRVGLYDMILVKENHIQAAGGLEAAIRAALDFASHSEPRLPVEIEVRSVEAAAQAAQSTVDRIMLDNMSTADMRQAMSRIRAISVENGRFVAVEASGNITLENVHAVAETGVDFISVGALTHSAPAFDFSYLVF